MRALYDGRESQIIQKDDAMSLDGPFLSSATRRRRHSVALQICLPAGRSCEVALRRVSFWAGVQI